MSSGHFLSVVSSKYMSVLQMYWYRYVILDTHTNRKGVFVVGVANFTSQVLSIRSLVDNTLSVMDVAIRRSTSRGGRIAGVAEIEEDEPSTAGGVARSGPDYICEASTTKHVRSVLI